MKGMAMSLRSCTLVALAGMIAAATLVTCTEAGDRWRHRGHPGFHNHNHNHAVRRIVVRQRVDVRQRVVVKVGRNSGTVVRAANSYSGDVAISYRPGVGTWSYGSVSTRQARPAARPALKIINLQGGGNDCSMEKGVCVIRP